MIFSKQRLDKAFASASIYYDKILELDLTKDQFFPIKVNDQEWNRIAEKYTRFTDWVNDFIISAYYEDDSLSGISLSMFGRLENLINITNVMVCKYRKYINNEWHDVLFEYYPTDDNRAFVFVKDWTLMERGITNE